LRVTIAIPSRAREWGLVTAPAGGVIGVYSRSEQPTAKRTGFDLANASLEGPARYADWKFIYAPPGEAAAAAADAIESDKAKLTRERDRDRARRAVAPTR